MVEQMKTRSSFARQIFIQFLASALVPVVILSFFVYITINDQFEDNINRQVYSESRSLGLTLFDRLQNMESNLQYVSTIVDEPALVEKYE